MRGSGKLQYEGYRSSGVRMDTTAALLADFCHWGGRFDYQPYDKSKGRVHEYIEWLDRQGIDLIVNKNRDGFTKYLEETRNTICGRNPIVLLLATLEKVTFPSQIRLLHYAQSSAASTFSDSSVSYVSAVVEQAIE
eukprot:gene2443-2933_t